MGGKKKEIVERYLSRKYLSRNPIECNIERILDKLHFEYHSSTGLCDLFSRPDFFQRHSHEFVSVFNQAYPNKAYSTKEFLVKGSCSDFDVLEGDLKTIGNILNENWFSRKIREKSKVLTYLLPLLGSGYLACLVYDKYIDTSMLHKTIEYLNMLTKLDKYPTTGGILIGVSGPLCVDMAASLINKHYASKLSDESECYVYGKDAEDSLRREFFSEGARSR